MEQLSAVILCGGRSRRMGRDKARLPWEDGELLDAIARGLTGAEEVLLAAAAAADYRDKPYQIVADCFPGCGPMAGLHSALTACRFPILFVTTCDMPLVDWNAARALYRFLDRASEAVVPVDGAGRVHPLCGLYRRQALPVLTRRLEAGQYRMTEALGGLAVRYAPAEILPYGEDTLRNLNTPEEYRAFLEQRTAAARKTGKE